MFALREQGPIVDADAACIVHPVRPARWGASIGQQSKVYFDALLYKHRATYRRHIRPVPPWHYYAAVLAALGALVLRGRVAGAGRGMRGGRPC